MSQKTQFCINSLFSSGFKLSLDNVTHKKFKGYLVPTKTCNLTKQNMK